MDAVATAVQGLDVLVRRSDLQDCAIVPAGLPDPAALPPGQALLRIERFGFTANNVTYGVLGESYQYWSYYPAPAGWGRLPVWGFAEVVATAGTGLQPGDRFWGFYPMSSHVVLQPTGIDATGFVDGTPHRQGLRAFYNRYSRQPAIAGAERAEDLQILLRPLFMTAFMLDDFLADNGFFAARTIVLSSASSKLALALAYLIGRIRRFDGRLVGLTAARTVPFVASRGLYAQVAAYDDVRSLPTDGPTLFVDFAGDRTVTEQVHGHWDDALVHSSMAGFAHWHGGGGAAARPLPGPPQTPFFVLDRSDKRVGDWGLQGLQSRFAAVWPPLVGMTEPWLKIVRARGSEAVRQVYADMLAGCSRPDQAHILTL